MDGRSRFWLRVEHSAHFSFRAEQPITVGSIRLALTPKAENGAGGNVEGGAAAEASDSKYLLWARCVPAVTLGDKVFCDHPPYVVASFTVGPDGVATAPPLRWEIGEKAVVSMWLARLTETPDAFAELNAHPPLHTANVNGDVVPEAETRAAPQLALDSIYNVTITLVGVKQEHEFQQSTWRPLLCFRWFELQGHIREATVPPITLERQARKRHRAEVQKRRMITGDVREASAVSSCGNYVLWQDGTLGLRRELLTYHRIYTPANENKHVRVRRFPHRFADIVGEVPFGSLVEAIGRQLDEYTKEQYALLVLSGTPEAATTAETYQLQCIEPHKWIWGWSKIASSTGLVLLADVMDTARSLLPDQGCVERLTNPTYYTSVREERSVRIRSGPSLSANVVGHLEPNEVKVAVAIHQCPPSHGGSSVPLRQHFVEWEEGGFSLLRNGDRVYLVPVHLQAQPRRFPLCPRPAPSSPEIIALQRRRRRTKSAGNTPTTPAKATTPSPELLSPADIPQAVAAGLKAGTVRLEELSKISLNGTPTHSSASSELSC
ncbi:uncharacterized protein Tco025E_08796 [Trypanosoma conorhini]|uniref:Uncharacterized protein n=1 Tax=Trypanosoma conorhini TaxID=83891 RepID=A0A422N4S3_9TRYP|nr:uncharacterized protein Tco025E_08796 [Trypanosoma conorhini]RNF00456.1 hypothetical protein Tco025E_08796 [Trypanosoma conorhini]